MNRKLLYSSTVLLLISLGIWAFSSNTSVATAEKKKLGPVPDTTFTLVFGGDLMGHQPMISAAWNDSTQRYEYEPWFQFIAPYLSSADYAVANLEVTLAGEPYSGYPQFSSPDAYASAIKKSGIDFLVTANNHSQDRGKAGLERTLRVLDSLGIPHTGTFLDTNSRKQTYPAMVTVKGCKIALLNYTYGTNGLVVKHPNIVNMIDTQWIINDFASIRVKQADAVIPVMHWGVEYITSENTDQRNTANLLARLGSTAIIGMHPHVVQPIKTIKMAKKGKRDSISVPVAYSLGNFVSNQRDINRDGGILVKLSFRKKNGKVELVGTEYLPFWVWRLQTASPQHGLRKGYYILTEKQLSMLGGEDLEKATLFFTNVRKIVSGSKEWKVQ